MGRHAYAIYLTHSTVGTLVFTLVSKTGLKERADEWVTAAGAAGAAGYAFRRWVQLPLGRLL